MFRGLPPFCGAPLYIDSDWAHCRRKSQSASACLLPVGNVTLVVCLGALFLYGHSCDQCPNCLQMKQGSVFCCCFTHRFTCSRFLSPCGPPGACPSFWNYCLIFLISRTRFLALYSCAKISARNASDVEAVKEIVDDIVPADEASITEVACVDDPPKRSHVVLRFIN